MPEWLYTLRSWAHGLLYRPRHHLRYGRRQKLVLHTQPTLAAPEPADPVEPPAAPPETPAESTTVIPTVGDLSWLGPPVTSRGSGWLPDGVVLPDQAPPDAPRTTTTTASVANDPTSWFAEHPATKEATP
jgi:hypothetical protein